METENRIQKENFLHQHAKVIWLTGLPCSGKTTLATHLEAALGKSKYFSCILDGDNLRSGLNTDLDFTVESRIENIRRISEVSKILIQNGIITIVSLVSPLREMRAVAEEIIGKGDFLEIYVNAPLAVCEQRDVKGMYRKARMGILKQFTGVDAVYEKPDHPFMEIDTEKYNIEQSVDLLLNKIIPVIKV